ncbi:MAG: competence protein ComEA [Kangiellaceae bacterium]|jgi:competence protein ComEA|nr:competence protein ComEA [Kangiellaceae bacterium]|tara:strand:+ start:363 stop:632 length:270 start_codon:yes stop_codon:yes gene_type:complete
MIQRYSQVIFLVLSLLLSGGAFATETIIDINHASAEELTELNGIGEVKAQAIIKYRTEHGPFVSVEDIVNVNGIGQGTLAKIKEQIKTK